MSIKATVTKVAAKKEREFPKLMQSKMNGDIVWMTSEGRGQVVAPIPGYTSELWSMSFFIEFEGSVTLQNE